MSLRHSNLNSCIGSSQARSRSQRRRRLTVTTGLIGLIGLLSHHSAFAQITPDTTWGAENSIATPNAIVQGQPATLIEGGAIRNTNLFHSFQSLNVSDGQRVYFANPAGIQTILSRITGNTASNILGTLGVDGSANLFLINPSGIIFGPNARLDVNGSFVATTAGGVQFGNQGFFNVSNPQAPPLLTINPSALWFNQRASQPVVNRSIADTVGLQLPSGRSLLFVGGDVQLEGGRILAPGGRVELAGITGQGFVGLQFDNNQWRLSFPNQVDRANVSLTNNAQVNVRSSGGGDIRINAKNVTMTGAGTQLLAGINPGLGSPNTQAGNIEIDATESVNLDASLIDNSVLGNAIGQGGSIQLAANSLSLVNGAVINNRLLGQGNAGNVTVWAEDAILLDGVGSRGSSSLRNSVEAGATGNGGNIVVTARSLTVQNGGRLESVTRGRGNAGNINLDVQNSISLIGVHVSEVNSLIRSQVLDRNTVGNAGDITLSTGSLLIKDGAGLLAATNGQGNAGKITIFARDTVSIDGISNTRFPFRSSISNSVRDAAVGNGNDINIATKTLFVKNGAIINASSSGAGNGGNITIFAEDLAAWDGTVRGFISSAGTAIEKNTTNFPGVVGNAAGNAGDLRVTAGNISVTNGALLTSNITNASGGAGNIIVNAANTITLSGSDQELLNPSSFYSFTAGETSANGGSIFVSANTLKASDGAMINARSLSSGRGGDITIDVKRLEIQNGSELLTTASFDGDAGNISVTASEQIVIAGRDSRFLERQRNLSQAFSLLSRQIRSPASSASGLFASTDATSTGQGGAISLNTGNLLVQDGGQISVSSQGAGVAGAINITAQSIQLRNQGRLTAETASSTGGDITLTVRDLLLLRNGSSISTTAGTAQQGGNGGNITINAPRGFIVGVQNENSDITANAFTGSGGRVDITAQGIYGLQFRPRLTPFSDITASSEFGVSGVVFINIPNLDPTQSLTQLPDVPVDIASLIEQELCAATQGSQFVLTGRGGLPDTPTAMLNSSAVWEDWRIAEQDRQRGQSSPQTLTTSTDLQRIEGHEPTRREPTPIVEAQGFVRAADGSIWLVANPTTVNPHAPWFVAPNCQSMNQTPHPMAAPLTKSATLLEP